MKVIVKFFEFCYFSRNYSTLIFVIYSREKICSLGSIFIGLLFFCNYTITTQIVSLAFKITKSIGTEHNNHLLGGPRKSLHLFLNYWYFCYVITTETCNTRMERKFCGLFGNIFKNCEKCSYEP